MSRPALPATAESGTTCVPVWCAGIDVQFGRARPPAIKRTAYIDVLGAEAVATARPTRTRGKARQSVGAGGARSEHVGSPVEVAEVAAPPNSFADLFQTSRPSSRLDDVCCRSSSIGQSRSWNAHRHLTAVAGEQRDRGRTAHRPRSCRRCRCGPRRSRAPPRCRTSTCRPA